MNEEKDKYETNKKLFKLDITDAIDLAFSMDLKQENDQFQSGQNNELQRIFDNYISVNNSKDLIVNSQQWIRLEEIDSQVELEKLNSSNN